MNPDRFLAPAFIRRAFFLVAAGLAGANLAAQRGPTAPESFGNAGRLDQAEGRRIFEEFRSKGIDGQYFLELELRVLPARGPERSITGRMWGTRNSQGELTRVALDLPAGEQRLLVQNGSRPDVWSRSPGANGPALELGEPALFESLAGTDLTPFDLLRPFLYWNESEYRGLTRVLGRPAHSYQLRPPAEFAARYPDLTGVRVYLDGQYQALVKAEYLGANGRPVKSMSVLELKKLGEQWIVKAVDLRNEVTRNKTRFIVTGAALNREFAAPIFTPAGLAESVAAPSSVTRIEP